MSIIPDLLQGYSNISERQKELLEFGSNVSTVLTFLVAPATLLYKKFINLSNSFKNKTNIELFHQFKLDEEKLTLLNNSEIFRKITKKTGSTVITEKIFECYDPHAAILLYSKRPSYVKFNELNYPCQPQHLLISKIFAYSIIFFLCYFPALISFIVLGIAILLNVNILSYFWPIITLITSIILFIICGEIWWNEIYIINIATIFYRNFVIYFKEKYINGFSVLDSHKNKLDFYENEWVEFCMKGKKLNGKILKFEQISQEDNFYIKKAIVKLDLFSWAKKIFFLLKVCFKNQLKTLMLKLLNRINMFLPKISLIESFKKIFKRVLIKFLKVENYGHSIKFILNKARRIEKCDLESLSYPDDLMKWSWRQYEFLLELQDKYHQDQQKNV